MENILRMNQYLPEENYLTEIHHLLEQDEKYLIDLHTYFYLKDFEVCPICNLWLVQRTKPKGGI